MELLELRKELDKVDDQMGALFLRRMDIARQVADVKRQSGKAVQDPNRERDIILRVCQKMPEELTGYGRVLMNTLFDLSRSYQRKLLGMESALVTQIKSAVEKTGLMFPQSASVACQGIAGAYSQLATDKLFPMADIVYFKNFEGVFSAVQKGLCQYGILPIENSSYGAVSGVAELMRQHKFHIVRSTKLQISHALLAKPGASMADITEIYSHEQALGQCSQFLSSHPQIKVTVWENTAVAARMVSQSERSDVACIASPECAKLYGLAVLDENVRNESGNYTRFICIAKDMEIYPGANKISLLLTTEHRPGALYGVLSKLAALGVNISKLESRPIPGRDFEFMFYFDLEASIYSEEMLLVLGELAGETQQFAFLGAYSEV